MNSKQFKLAFTELKAFLQTNEPSLLKYIDDYDECKLVFSVVRDEWRITNAISACEKYLPLILKGSGVDLMKHIDWFMTFNAKWLASDL